MTPSRKPKGIDVAALKQQTAGPLGTAIALNAFCHQLKMLVEELRRYAPGQGEAISHGERLLWSRARGALRAAKTHLENLADSVFQIENSKNDRSETR